MIRSAREIPHFHLMREIDMSAALAWLTAENAKRTVTDRLLYAALLIKAVALSLREMPDLNGAWADGRVQRKPDINVGMAISLRGGGLVAPALLKADERSLSDLMAGFRDLVQRARAGKLVARCRSHDVIPTSAGWGGRGVRRHLQTSRAHRWRIIGKTVIVGRP
jgi:pyruvate dehydrogenase E2 component (dihydrolipoamide acetyltransferase)